MWETYRGRGARPSLPAPRFVPRSADEAAGTAKPALHGLALGNHFDDDTWREVLRIRGWETASVRGLPGWVSPVVGDGTRVLFAAPELSTGGLDDTPFLFGFRVPSSDVDEVWRCIPHGDGELIFDHLAHAGASFSRTDFLAWVKTASMADAVRL